MAASIRRSDAARSLIADARELLRPRARRERGEFIAEGVRFVSDALAAGVVPRRVFISPQLLQRTEHGRALLTQLGSIDVLEVASSTLEALADTRTPQGVVAIFPRPLSSSDAPLGQTLLILDGVQDPGNVGTILRSAVGSGLVTTVLVRGGADPFGPKAVRAASSAIFHLGIIQPSDAELPELLATRSVVTADAAGEQAYDRYDWRQPTALVIGSEAAGPTLELRRLATTSLRIPLRGPIESLNAGIAASIMLFEAARQRGVH